MSTPVDQALSSSATANIDYERKLWGAHEVEPKPRYLGGLRLLYCLEDLSGIRGRVLEVGCGGGAMARAVKRHRPDLVVHALDLSTNALRTAETGTPKVRYVAGDAHGLPALSDSYDAVVVLDVLEHLPNPQRALREIQRVLKPGGLLHLFCPVEGDFRNLHGILHRLGWRSKERLIGHIQQYTESELIDQLQRADLHETRTQWSGHLVNQIADVAYFTLLDLTGREKRGSVELPVVAGASGIGNRLIRALSSLVAALSFYESQIARTVPGSGLHIKAAAVNGSFYWSRRHLRQVQR